MLCRGWVGVSEACESRLAGIHQLLTDPTLAGSARRGPLGHFPAFLPSFLVPAGFWLLYITLAVSKKEALPSNVRGK